jgi:hypothetical protein
VFNFTFQHLYKAKTGWWHLTNSSTLMENATNSAVTKALRLTMDPTTMGINTEHGYESTNRDPWE